MAKLQTIDDSFCKDYLFRYTKRRLPLNVMTAKSSNYNPIPHAQQPDCPADQKVYEYFASAIPGTETALCEELRDLRFDSVRLNRGGIPFRGTREAGWLACLTSRIAQRIQRLLTRFQAVDEQALYQGVQAVDWSDVLSPDLTLSVRAVTSASWLTHQNYAALKIKDAIVDQIRDRTGSRPSVNRSDADVDVFAYMTGSKCAVYLSLAGEAMHRRGYRLRTGAAPLRETLASAVLRLSGWDRVMPLIDPMCGAGTLPIEAAQWARNQAPGLAHERLGFERWADFSQYDAERLQAIKGVLRRNAGKDGVRVQAADIDPLMIDAAKANARAAGVRLTFRERDVMDLQANSLKVQVVTNPPFGNRLDMYPDFPRRLGAAVCRWHGWRVAILAGSPLYRKSIGLRPQAVYPLRNGDLDCELLNYEVP